MDIACMSNRDPRATETSQPRKLYKPRREAGALKPEVMVTYASECEFSTTDGLNTGADFSAGD
jgi:hypothetical protein